ncbi:hypothetical protein QBC37DRAFT_453221 [Rhypophila decipiens]|uniref:3-beta hydroxysteroid dehydrogenase/isomerase domain-containing protein n=1 Tax=Rhypophila decipiens TaxID=261697 RepID=A0AAN6XZ66_9PEZI|nr:hypothetical protein QBC37DRAFT_453221 [Rhypophila decipiens]
MASKPQALPSPIIVTGSCGFIGSHLVDGILALDPSSEIHVLDIKHRNLANGVKYHLTDVSDAAAIDAIFHKIKPKVIFHVATADALSRNDSILRRVIVDGTHNVLTSAIKVATVQAFVFTSTSSLVHDNVSDLINADETFPVLQYPQQKKAYTLCKAVAEAEVLAANNTAAENGMLTGAIRPVTNFGPRDYTMTGKMVASIREGKGRYQIGNGQNIFSFTYVSDTVDAHLLLATALVRIYGTAPTRLDAAKSSGSREEVDRPDGQAFNVTNDEDWLFWDFQRALATSIGHPIDPASVIVVLFWLAVSMAWLAEWLKWIVTFGRGKSAVTWEAIYYTAHHRTVSCAKAKRVLGYKPRVKMQEGMDITGKWFVELEKNPKREAGNE